MRLVAITPKKVERLFRSSDDAGGAFSLGRGLNRHVALSTNPRCLVGFPTRLDARRQSGRPAHAPSGSTVAGTLVLPFGLALDSGVTFQIDDRQASQAVRFRTCLPGGCLVSVTFDAPTLVALRTATALKVKTVADGGAATPFSISLQGFATALDRVGALSR